MAVVAPAGAPADPAPRIEKRGILPVLLVTMGKTSPRPNSLEKQRDEIDKIDAKILELLNRRGVRIARRTVAKYRAELNILPSTLR